MRKPEFWIDHYGVVARANWDKKPNRNYRPIIYCDRPVPKERLKDLWVEAEGKPLRFARLIEAEHGIRKFEVEGEQDER